MIKCKCLCPLDPPQIILQPVAARLRTCRTSSAASSSPELPVMRLLTEDSSHREPLRLMPPQQRRGRQTCSQGPLLKQGSSAQEPSGATPANPGLKQENPRAGARRFASHSSAEKGTILRRGGALCVAMLWRDIGQLVQQNEDKSSWPHLNIQCWRFDASWYKMKRHWIS